MARNPLTITTIFVTHISPSYCSISGPAFNILIKLMSMISLTVAPIIRGWEDWEHWYWGILPIGLAAIATLLVHHFYWKNSQDIAAPIDELVKDAPEKVVETPSGGSADVEVGAGED